MVASNMLVFKTTATLLCLLFSADNAEIVKKPNDTEGVVGQLVYFNCSSSISAEIQWMFFSPGGDREGSIIYGYNKIYAPFNERFRVEIIVAAASYDLIIDSILPTDAGRYECQDDVGRGAKSSAELIVLDSELVCQSNIDTNKVIGNNGCGIEPSLLLLSCSVSFHGNEAPIMQWTKDGDISFAGTVNHAINGNRVFYNLTMNGGSIPNNSYYQCNTTRSLSTKNGCDSNNIRITGNSCATCATCPVCNYDGYITAIIFLSVLLVTIGVAIVSAWYYIRTCKRPDLRKRLIEAIFGPSPQMPGSRNADQYQTLSSDETKRLFHNENWRDDPTEAEIPTAPDSQLMHHPSFGGGENGEIIPYVNKIKELEITINKMETEAKQFISTVECHLYPNDAVDYIDKPKQIHSITAGNLSIVKDKKKAKTPGPAVSGIAVLGEELFLVTNARADIEVYDSETFKFVRNFLVAEMQNPLDIASSKVNKSLYIINQVTNTDRPKCEIIRINANGENLNRWYTRGSFGGRLSTYQSNVIVCLQEEQIIYEFTQKGEIIMTVRLSPGAGINNPWHAVKVTNIHFVVSHGDVKDKVHRVCVVDKEGKIIKVCNLWEKKTHAELKVPICLLENRDRRILVADREHKTILLLSSVLRYERKLIEEDKKGLKDFPTRICFDEAEYRLFVATNKRDAHGNWEDGRVLIYNLKSSI